MRTAARPGHRGLERRSSARRPAPRCVALRHRARCHQRGVRFLAGARVAQHSQTIAFGQASPAAPVVCLGAQVPCRPRLHRAPGPPRIAARRAAGPAAAPISGIIFNETAGAWQRAEGRSVGALRERAGCQGIAAAWALAQHRTARTPLNLTHHCHNESATHRPPRGRAGRLTNTRSKTDGNSITFPLSTTLLQPLRWPLSATGAQAQGVVNAVQHRRPGAEAAIHEFTRRPGQGEPGPSRYGRDCRATGAVAEPVQNLFGVAQVPCRDVMQARCAADSPCYRQAPQRRADRPARHARRLGEINR